ncbi:MAG: ATP-binding cassette domain-containing protein [Chitinophagaceae bacterium]|nr:ATP-binding cassette domain-containing protein [Chitinophagaceae bacterium]
MLDIQHLKKYYATQKAVDDVSLRVRKGSIFGLLGPNGAGKSSLLRMVTGITMPDEGKILFDGEDFVLDKHSRHIGYMPEERGLYKKMKIGEQALYLAQLKGLSKTEALENIRYWFNKLDMHSWWNKKVEDLSKGMSQKLQFVTTVVHHPKLLILDEPFSGLDPVNSEVIKDEIHELANKGTTIIFSTHRMEQVEEICEEIALIHQGKVVLGGAVSEIKQRFKENLYQLQVDGEIQYAAAQYLQREGNQYTYKFQSEDESRGLLQYCLDQRLPIRSFHEILPTLNQIFIRQVEGEAARIFDTK